MMMRRLLTPVLALALVAAMPQHAEAKTNTAGIAAAVTAATIGLAAACGPAFANCLATNEASVSQGVGVVLNTVMTTFKTAFFARLKEKLGIAEMIHDKKLNMAGQQAKSVMAKTPGPNNGAGAAQTAATIAGGGGRAQRCGNPASTEPLSISFQASGKMPKGWGTMTYRGSSAGMPAGAVAELQGKAYMEQWDEQERFVAENGANIANMAQMRYDLENYGDCSLQGKVDEKGQPKNCEWGKMPGANLKVSSIFGHDTFKQGIYEQDPRDKKPQVTAEQRSQAAKDFCKAAIKPIFTDKIRPAPENESGSTGMSRLGESGNDTRLNMAFSACIDLVNARTPTDFSTEDKQYYWIFSAVCENRKRMCAADSTAEGCQNLDQSGWCNGGQAGGKPMQISKYEMLQTASANLFTVPEAMAKLQDNQDQLLSMLISVEVIEGQLNFEMLKMQERIQLLQAARLAADVQGGQ